MRMQKLCLTPLILCEKSALAILVRIQSARSVPVRIFLSSALFQVILHSWLARARALAQRRWREK
jgi:hypothetical protein